jgi:serine/threonine protein kinase
MLGERIGVGGMGVVYRAHQVPLDRVVAVKFLRPDVESNSHALRRFRYEGLATGRVRHRNVVRMIEYVHDTGRRPFLVLEHLGGELLGSVLEREGAMSQTRATSLIVQLLVALGEAHRCGVIHADVKTDNLVVAPTDAEGRELVTLIDFGLACLHDHPNPTDARAHTVSGTAAYLAPELARGDAPTPRSDLYSAGIVLYEVVTGATPFGGGTVRAIMNRHMFDAVAPPSRKAPAAGLPAAFDEVVLRALAKDPADRFPTARAFASALVVAISMRSRPQRDDSQAVRRARVARREMIAGGDPDRTAIASLQLARALIDDHRLGGALDELDEAIQIVTAGEGIESTSAPASLWRLLLSTAAIRDGLGDKRRARADGEAALDQASRARSRIGCERAWTLLARLRQRYPTGSSK